MQPARTLIAAVAAIRALVGTASAQTQAASLKIDMTQFDACTQGTEYDTAISKDMTEGAGFSVNGTPTFFVGKTTAQGFEGFRIVGAQPFTVFQQRIEGLLK
jgi:protein-disulfide isomerase